MAIKHKAKLLVTQPKEKLCNASLKALKLLSEKHKIVKIDKGYKIEL